MQADLQPWPTNGGKHWQGLLAYNEKRRHDSVGLFLPAFARTACTCVRVHRGLVAKADLVSNIPRKKESFERK